MMEDASLRFYIRDIEKNGDIVTNDDLGTRHGESYAYSESRRMDKLYGMAPSYTCGAKHSKNDNLKSNEPRFSGQDRTATDNWQDGPI